MGITIDEYNAAKEYHACVETIMDKLWTESVKYHMLQDQYETRLKADIVAILEEIQLEIKELPMYYDPMDISDLIQCKIDALKAERSE